MRLGTREAQDPVESSDCSRGLTPFPLSRETVETKSFSRFIPLLLFLVQKKETILSAKLCVMVSPDSNAYSIGPPTVHTSITMCKHNSWCVYVWLPTRCLK